MKFLRMPIEIESPEMMGYDNVRYNLTESSVADARLDDLQIDLRGTALAYGDHIGYLPLREKIAAKYTLHPEDILITAGAASALFIAHTAILDKGDHILVMHPNYGTNIETPRALNADVDFMELVFENGFRPDFDEIKGKITEETRLISITHPHNPTGVCLTRNELETFIQLAEAHDIYLLVDETYRDLQYHEKLPLAASLSEKAISVSSMSKAYGLPGIRIGWMITGNRELQETFLAAKEQIFICNSLVDEKIAALFLENEEMHTQRIQQQVSRNFEEVCSWMQQENRMEWIKPTGGVVCFPRIKEDVAVDIEKFYQTLNLKHQTFVGPGHWFEMDKRYMRIGYGWPTTDELKAGLEIISRSLSETINA